MKTTRRRYWVFFLLFLFNLIAYVDRVNMSVAGKPIAQEFGLSPVALGYLFSSFLWAYVLMMLPGGRLIDRWGAHVIASVATAVWSAAQMATGVVSSFAAMLVTRLGSAIFQYLISSDVRYAAASGYRSDPRRAVAHLVAAVFRPDQAGLDRDGGGPPQGARPRSDRRSGYGENEAETLR